MAPMLGKAADDILDPEEVRSACARDERVRRQVEVLAFNLAFDPEVRCRPGPLRIFLQR